MGSEITLRELYIVKCVGSRLDSSLQLHTETYLWNAKVVLGKLHCIGNILKAIVGIEGGVIRDEPRPTVVYECRKICAIIPVGPEIFDLFVLEDSLEPAKEDLTWCGAFRRDA